MTNVTHEHLDYHKTFERYRTAKTRLFKLARRVGIINADDPSAAVFEQAVPRSLCYGIADGNIRATNITQTASGSRYDVWLMGEMHHITINMPGEFNIANSLAAVAVGHEVGLSRVQIEHGLAALTGVDGRMTVVDAGQPFSAIVDFAHTPDAFERLLGSVRASTKGKLIVLFGSAGRRDESKRAIQGKIAGELLTSLLSPKKTTATSMGNTSSPKSPKAQKPLAKPKIPTSSSSTTALRPSALLFAVPAPPATPLSSLAKATKKPSNAPTAPTPGTK